MPKKVTEDVVTWIGKQTNVEQMGENFLYFYEQFKFKKLTASIGDFVLVSNADAADPDTEDGCDAAKILSLYENREKKGDPFRAKVQWYTKMCDLPASAVDENIKFIDKDMVEDHRPFDTDVSIETFFKKCNIIFTYTRDDPDIVLNKQPYTYICRYRVLPEGRKKLKIEPILEEERKAMEFLSTPKRASQTPKSQTPNSLTKRMSRVSISEQKNWSVTKNEGTKILLKRAILADKTEKNSPKKNTPKKGETPKSSIKLSGNKIEEIVSMELEENSDEELPTLIIKKAPNTPKRKPSISTSLQETPKKVLIEDKKEYSTRSGRATRNPIHYYEADLSPVKSTPKKQIRKADINEFSDDEFKPKLLTPKTPKTPRTPRSTTRIATPRSVSRRIMASQLTPTLRTRRHSVDRAVEYAKKNKSLPGREQQLDEILSFVRSKLLDGSSGCMYISGVPGTGKTATVNSALQILKEESEMPDFTLVEVNGMRITEPRQAYVQIYKQLTGKSVAWEQACSLLEKRFTTVGPRRTSTVLLVDELDALCNRRQDVLYSIMEWTGHTNAMLTVIAVANTMDLPERALASRVASRLGLTRLTFLPYSHSQLQTIVETKLANADVTKDAVQLIARKVAAVSGDARRALALCSRAMEIAASRVRGGIGPPEAGLKDVAEALQEASSGLAVSTIKYCSMAERLMLRAVAAEVERTGTDETTLSRVLRAASAITALDGRPYRSAVSIRAPSPSQALAICARLAALRLLLVEPKAGEPRILLNVSPDDVHYATKEISV